MNEIKEMVKAMQKRRIKEGLSLRALSKIVGVAFSSLSRIERGRGLPDRYSAEKIAKWLKFNLPSDAKNSETPFEKLENRIKRIETYLRLD